MTFNTFLYKAYNRYLLFLDIRKHYFYIGFNQWLFERKDIEYGNNLKVYNKINISNKGLIKIGNNLVISSGGHYNPICKNIEASISVSKKGKLIIGNNVGMSSPCIMVRDCVRIGNNVNIGGNCFIMDNDSHPLDAKQRRFIPHNNNEWEKYESWIRHAPITIEDDVWLGANCTVLKGVTIGARSVIGANSVVTKDIPSDCIAVGNPCKVLKYFNNSLSTTV